MIWGVDLGGTKIEGVVLKAPHNTECLCRLRVPTEADLGYEHIISQISVLVDAMSMEVGCRPESVGFGTPGIASPSTGLMKNSNSTALNGKPLKKDLCELLGCEIAIANDANCFALAETLFGSARGKRNVFGVIVGTGVGGGIVIDGHIVNGVHGIAGEWGHNQLDPRGNACYCGKRGCVETVISGPAVEHFYYSKSGIELGLKEIVGKARAGADVFARETVEHLTENFGRALATVINILDPEVVVLGGGVGNVEELYTDGVESLRRWLFNDEVRTKLVHPELGDSAGVFGAAHLFLK